MSQDRKDGLFCDLSVIIMCSLIEEPVKITKEASRDKFLKKKRASKSEN